MTELCKLRVNANNLSGGVLDFLGSMTRLRVLELDGNLLGRQLPRTLGWLWRLQYLDLKDARLVSVVPPELGKLRKLQFMDIYKNRLTGALPASLASMRSMREFDVSSNNFSREIPGALLASWPELISFQAQDNALTDNIPLEYDKDSNMTVLYLFHNNLTVLPREIDELMNLEVLDLSFNLTTESTPAHLAPSRNSRGWLSA